MMLMRPMTKRDIARVYEIEVQSFRSPWSKLSLLGELRNDVAHYYVAEEEGRVIGYAGMWLLFDEAHITNIAIAPEQRGRHLGRYLLYGMMEAASERGAEKMTLEVRETNAVAQNLYYSFDFEKQGFRKRYYDDTGEGALLLWNDDLEVTLEKNACLKTAFVLQ
ncbi:MAG: ribosomal protein S18-alanine N-acetyltransferase [Clostridia bacterium]|nr:ribosomal protein S18-alanine N-acetyltransferase [Clostridia bacterium]